MYWLVLAEGIPIGAWQQVIGLDGQYTLCNNETLETIHHTFWACPHVRLARVKLNFLCSTAYLPTLAIWEDVLFGQLTLQHQNGTSSLMSTIKISTKTPWTLLRALILWNIWCSKRSFDHDKDTYHTGLVLYKVWVTTIYIGMEAWRDLQCYNRPWL